MVALLLSLVRTFISVSLLQLNICEDLLGRKHLLDLDTRPFSQKKHSKDTVIVLNPNEFMLFRFSREPAYPFLLTILAI